jgi:hypothetical protein
MNAKKVNADQKLAFVEKIIASDIFNSSEVAAVAILQQLVDDAKKEIATQFVNKQDVEARKSGKMIANKKEAIKIAATAVSFDTDTIAGAYARELGVQL